MIESIRESNRCSFTDREIPFNFQNSSELPKLAPCESFTSLEICMAVSFVGTKILKVVNYFQVRVFRNLNDCFSFDHFCSRIFNISDHYFGLVIVNASANFLC